MVQRLIALLRRPFTRKGSRGPFWERPVPEKDPIVQSTLATPMAVSSLLLMVTLIWAFYEEGWGLRPWRSYQDQFVERYTTFLKGLKPRQASQEAEIRSSEGYLDLQRQQQEAEAAVKPQLAEIAAEEAGIDAKLRAIEKTFTTARSEVQATIYLIETTSGSTRQGHEEERGRLEKGPFEVRLPGEDASQELTFPELEDMFNSLKERQGKARARKAVVLQRPGQIRRKMQTYVANRMEGLTASQVQGLINSLDDFEYGIQQIHNGGMGLVDRCESCHLGITEPVRIRAADMGGMELFTSHPRKQLLDVHDPEIFGCSPCHNGNGIGTVSAVTGHGRYKHWLWPLYAPENMEAGCVRCHGDAARLEMAPVLSAGREQFRWRGCWGCHPRQGFDQERLALRINQKGVSNLEAEKEAVRLRIERTVVRADDSETNEEANRLYAEADRLTLTIAGLDIRADRERERGRQLLEEVKTPGPNLKEVRVKVRRDWLPGWIENPHSFRPTTKMPRFRLEEDQAQAIAAFIWQSGVNGDLETQAQGEPERGKVLFETRGCMACHAIGEGDEAVGGTFAANLSRVGDKVHYDYLVRWIHNPRERTLPYCPVHKRDITPKDYASAGKPFRFDLQNLQCPLGEHILQVQNPTVMPNLRLTWEESRDIATYLKSRAQGAEYPAAAWLEDSELTPRGRAMVRHFGCAGCHEIATLEEEGKIGTDLTEEGSKPLERLDFALLTKAAKREGWYNHKGFFERKLENPAVYDDGKIKEPLERLRMPNFGLDPEEIRQLATYLLGSVTPEDRVPERYHYRPQDQRSHIQEGWDIVLKYNCMGCHQVAPGQQPVVKGLPLYQQEDWREQLPPPLVGEGARVNPNWLTRFLKNPALDEDRLHRNGVRPYLRIRMPTFTLSDGEVEKLVRFFGALGQQPLPYLPKTPEPLSQRELTMARQLFTHPAAPCLRCHATGDPQHDRNATAPSFELVSERLQPDWTRRWMVHPEIIQPGTSMPSGLFEREENRWIFALADLPIMKDYEKDHADLVLRYMFQFTQQEQRRLRGR